MFPWTYRQLSVHSFHAEAVTLLVKSGTDAN